MEKAGRRASRLLTYKHTRAGAAEKYFIRGYRSEGAERVEVYHPSFVRAVGNIARVCRCLCVRVFTVAIFVVSGRYALGLCTQRNSTGVISDDDDDERDVSVVRVPSKETKKKQT